VDERAKEEREGTPFNFQMNTSQLEFMNALVGYIFSLFPFTPLYNILIIIMRDNIFHFNI